LIIVVWLSVPTSVSGSAARYSPLVTRHLHYDFRKVLQVHLVHDAGRGRHNPEIVEGLLPPAQELVTLAVALEFDVGVQAQRIRHAKVVYLHRVVDDEIDRDERVDLLWIAA